MFDANISIWPFYHTETVEERRKFVIKVYLEFLGFLVLGFVHWILMLTLLQDWISDLVREHTSALLLAFVVGMFLLLLFALSKPLRKMTCINWMVALIIVECVVVSLSVLIITSGMLYMLAGFLIVAVVVVFTTLISALMTYDLTGTGIYLYMLAYGAYMLSLYSLVLYTVLDVFWGFYLFAGLIACVVLIVRIFRFPFSATVWCITTTHHLQFLMYHVQCITGGRRASTALYDDKLAALLLFHEFLGLFVLTLYWRPIMERLQLKQ
ncbi:uncharacterized protein LOC108039652 [Drosophila rhopaloa]|uniref:Protein lifeguard 1 n=1 Tax=Drosophila rhopaloa TaxID=1041015 RepID=A0ABM5GZI6_DRORH|nr:uncharacterized protein LOC108039652 [Drosophila rhopaloa]